MSLDGTLPNGRTDTLTGPDYVITEDLGYRNGINLFHSFQQFDVGTGESATFSAVLPTSNVIARVTSFDPMTGQTNPQASQINGAVRFAPSLGNANFFFVNPAGIVFGPSAAVEIAGATYATTADYLRFDDANGTTIDSASPNVDWNGLMLQSASPAAFGFLGGAAAADVRIDGDPSNFSSLALPGDRFVAVGGDVTITQAVTAPGGQIGLAAVGRATVEVPVDVESFDARSGDPSALGRVAILPTVATAAGIDTVFNSTTPGTIVIRGGRFEVEGTGVFLFGGGQLAGSGQAIDVEVAGDVSIRSGAQLAAFGAAPAAFGGVRVEAGGTVVVDAATVASLSEGGGNGDGVDVRGAAIDLVNGASVLSISNAGSAGDVTLTSAGSLTIDGSEVDSSTATNSAGGSIAVSAAELAVLRGGKLTTSSSASAPAGAIEVGADRVVVRDAGSTISTVNAMQTPGDPTTPSGGAISISATGEGLSLQNGGNIATQSTGSRAGGSVDIATTALVVASGGSIETSATQAGSGGDITIDATSVDVRSTPGSAATSQISAIVASNATGHGGDITVDTATLALRDGGQIRATTRGSSAMPGDATGGDITIRATGTVALQGVNQVTANDIRPAGIFARAGAGGTQGNGNGGNIDVEAASIEVSDGAEVSSRSLSTGDAGDVRLFATGSIVIAGNGVQESGVSARGFNGAGGNVRLEGSTVSLLRGGNAAVSTLGTGAGGLLTVRAGSLTIDGTDLAGASPSGLAAEALGSGAAGGIDITATDSVSVSGGGAITARSSSDGGSGSIVIRDASIVGLSSGGQISARATGPAAGGSITIDVPGQVVMSGGSIDAASNTGAGGSIVVDADQQLFMANGAVISARAAGAQPAGNVEITSTGAVTLDSGSRITAEATGTGDAGSITIAAGQLLDLATASITTQAEQGLGGNIDITASERVYLLQSQISTSVKGGSGSGGNITIDPQFVILNQSQIIAQANAGAGGNISITTDNYVPSGNSLVSASSRLGIDGTVAVSTPEAQLAGQIAALPENLLDATALLREACEVRDAPVGSFSVRTVRPLAPPDAPLDPDGGAAAVCGKR